MAPGLTIQINGAERSFAGVADGVTVAALLEALGFRADRIALERNGDILPRARWQEASIHTGDRLEIVHFVGGGSNSTEGARP